MIDLNDKLLLPSSTRSIKRRTSLFEKSRDWARRLMTLHHPRRNTIFNIKVREIFSQSPETTKHSSENILHNYQKNFDEDGYLSPLEIKAKLDDITRETNHHQSQSTPEQFLSNSNLSPLIYRYHDPNISIKSSQCTCQEQKRSPTTSFVTEFQNSLSIVDYIDLDVSDELAKQENNPDDPLESLKYLFHLNSKQQPQGNLSRRIPRRATNASSISTDSGYSDIPSSSTSKLIPVHLISCSLIPVNVHCLTCTYCSSSSSSSPTCLTNHPERKFFSHSSRNRNENATPNQCLCQNKSHSTMTIYPSIRPTKSVTKIDDYSPSHPRPLKNQRSSLLRHPTITDDFISISRWYKPYLEREAVCHVLQQADYGAFILRNSTTHADCYALSIKVPKFTHESNIVHYLIEKSMTNDHPNYRIKVMPEILPITLNLNESFTI